MTPRPDAAKFAEKHNAAVKAKPDDVLGDTPAKPGHNSQARLRSFVERVENLEAEKKGIADDIRDVYAEAKGNGYDVKALRAIVKLRKQDKDDLAEHEAIVDTYKAALGMLD